MPDTQHEPLSYDEDYDILQGRLSALRRHHPERDLSELETHLKTMKLARYVRRALAEAPPLSAKQRAHVARILRESPGTRP